MIKLLYLPHGRTTDFYQLQQLSTIAHHDDKEQDNA